MRPLPSHTARFRTRSASAGFTLLELLFVITLMGILAGMALPRLNDSARVHRLERAADALADKIRHGRAFAIRSGLRVRLKIAADERSYVLELQKIDGGAAPTYGPFSDAYLDAETRLPEGIRLFVANDSQRPGEDSGAEMVFEPSGTGGETYIRLADKDGKTVSIDLGALRDDVRVRKGGPNE